MTGVVDSHAHVIVPEILRGAGSDPEWGPLVRWEGGRQVVEFQGSSITSAIREFVDVDAIVEAQGRVGVDRTVLSPWVALLGHELPLDRALAVCRLQNAGLAAAVDSHRGTISALGTVPLQDPALAARELRSLMEQSALSGVEVAASVGDLSLGANAFEPFWGAAEATGALVFVHPTTRGFGLEALHDHYLWNTVGNPLETAVAAAHMVVAGVMERHPALRVLLAHGGGALLAVRGRLRHAQRLQPKARAVLLESPDESLRRFHFDTITHDADLLRALVDYAGPDRVLMGSDHPFDMGVDCPRGPVEELHLPPEDEAAILGGNAARLLGLPDPASGGRIR